MPRSKKTHTTYTDRSEPRHLRKFRKIRLEVAAEAARIIATEGQHNYHAAKKKAAERVGVSERLALPSNIEVKEALRQHQGLYGGESHQQSLYILRTTALEAMQSLQAFNPRLVGAVLDGTANEHSRIALHVFAESVESVVLFFLERDIPFSQEQRQIRWHSGGHRNIPLILTELNGQVVELAVFAEIDLRQAPPSPIDGKPQRRAALYEVEILVAEATA
jgi:hypothetical protein